MLIKVCLLWTPPAAVPPCFEWRIKPLYLPACLIDCLIDCLLGVGCTAGARGCPQVGGWMGGGQAWVAVLAAPSLAGGTPANRIE